MEYYFKFKTFILELDPQACELFVQMKITKDGSSYPASDQVIINE